MPITPQRIDGYLRRKGSPLAGLGKTFVAAGRIAGVDPSLLVAISGAESSFGVKVPKGTNNPFGWGPGIGFRDYEDAILTVARGLRKGYIDEGLTTIPAIQQKWAPSGASNDPTNLNSNWTRNVSRFVSELGGTAAVSPGSSRMMASSTAPPMASGPSSDLTSSVLRSLSRGAAGARIDPAAQLSDLVSSSIAANIGTLSPARSRRSLASSGASSSQEGFQPEFESRLNQLLAAVPGLKVASGYRSVEEQERLWQNAIRKYGSEEAARKWVAPPGRSRHNMGLAADLSGDLARAHELAPRFGLVFPMPWENWHIELAGARS